LSVKKVDRFIKNELKRIIAEHPQLMKDFERGKREEEEEDEPVI
jgi:hypothetical protein